MLTMKKITLFLFLITSLQVSSQESNCSDCIDNDGDTLVDCADSDCSSAENCQQSLTIPCTTNSTFYQVLGGNEFVSYDPDSLSYNSIFTNSYQINGIGYNVQDGFIYGIRHESNRIVRVGSDGVFNNLGVVSGLPNPGNDTYFVGDCDLNGNLYVYYPSLTTVYRINIDYSNCPTPNFSATPINMVPAMSIDIADFSFLPSTGLLYGATSNTGILYSFDPATGVVTNLGSPSPSINCGSDYGASFADINGSLYFFCNSDGNLYIVNPESMNSTLLHATGITLSTNDGAACVLSSGLVSVQTTEALTQIQVISNPFSDHVTLQSPKSTDTTYDIFIYDMQGKQFYSGLLNDNLQINTADWASGVYILKVMYKGKLVGKEKLMRQ